MAVDKKRLYDALAELNLVPKELLDAALKEAEETQVSLDQVLVARDLLTDIDIGRVMADLLTVPYVSLAKEPINDETLQIIPEIVARKQRLIAFGQENGVLKLATSQPGNQEILDFVAKKTGEKVAVFFAVDRDIEQALGLYKKDLQKSFDDLLKEQVVEAKKGDKGEAPIQRMVDLLIEYAYGNHASDIHVEPEKTESLVRFRIDGILHDVLRLPKNLHDQVVARIKVAAKLKTDEHLSAQDGKMQLGLSSEDLDIRVSVVPIINGEKVVLRLLSSKLRQFTLSDLGMKEADLEKVKEGFTKPFGMVLSTGPTGSGKTTTIYAILKVINTRDVNIATVEDPVEYDIAGINQIQVNPKTNLTFANGLRAILRQDPNIIFVGEIRDDETADIAVNSATTGHLVLSTLHTNNAATALPRLLDMKIEPYLVASTVNVIIGQRLVRKICEKCRYSLAVKLADLTKHIPKDLLKKIFGLKEEARVYRGKGCPVCHSTGFSGRVGIFEVLVVSDPIKELIVAKATSAELEKKAIALGMTPMVEDGLGKAARGITTVEEVLRATKE